MVPNSTIEHWYHPARNDSSFVWPTVQADSPHTATTIRHMEDILQGDYSVNSEHLVTDAIRTNNLPSKDFISKIGSK